MQTFTIGWPHRWPFHGLGRNELLRLSDRVESIAAMIFGVLAIIAIPLAASVATTVHDFEVVEQASQAATVQQTAATVVAEPHVSALFLVDARWSVPVRWESGGVVREGTISSEQPGTVGDHVQIWVDRGGALTVEPATGGSAVADAVGVGIVLWLAMIGACVGMLQFIRWRLDAGRLVRWEREWGTLADDGGGRTRR